jgi:hypothetical protein
VLLSKTPRNNHREQHNTHGEREREREAQRERERGEGGRGFARQKSSKK